MAATGSLLRLDSRGGTVICLPPQDNRSLQDIINIMIREMACINFWEVNSCSCEQCRCTKGPLKICDFLAYISELNAFLNFQLTGFGSQWKIGSDDFSILKDIVQDLQVAKRLHQEFKTPKPAPEVTLAVEKPLDNEESAPEVTSPVSKPAPEVSLMVKEPLQTQDAATEVSSPVQEPLEKQDTTPEVPSPIQEQETAAEVTSIVEELLETEDTASEDTLLDEEPMEKQDTVPEVTSPIEEQEAAAEVTSTVEEPLETLHTE